jgi:hypothetical protein
MFILGMLVLGGCTRSPSVQAENGIDTEAMDPESGVVVRTHMDKDEIGIADRLKVQVFVEWEPPARAALVEPDFADSGWSLIESHQDPLVTTATGFVESSTFLLEPFLAGAYRVPAFWVEVTPDRNAKPYEFASMESSITVRSSLDAQDAGALDPAYGLAPPPSASDQRLSMSRMVIGGIVGFGIFAGLCFWWFTRGSLDRPKLESVLDQLQKVANNANQSDADAYDMLYHAITRLDERLQNTSEIRALIQSCEQARFSAGEHGALDPRAMARHTLELLGESESEAA